MIKINLLRERKTSRADKGKQSLLAGLGIVVASTAAVWLLVHVPLESSIDELRSGNRRRQQNIAKLQEETKEFDTVQAQLNAAIDQEKSINRLNDARAVPAWMLHEMATILTRDRQPTMSVEMAQRIKNDPNRQLSPGWDPRRLWLTSIAEKDGVLTISGGAQATTDVTQFAQRLQASVYFRDVEPSLVRSASTDGSAKVTYYHFTITGRVLY